jgi:hypothetical protein
LSGQFAAEQGLPDLRRFDSNSRSHAPRGDINICHAISLHHNAVLLGHISAALVHSTSAALMNFALFLWPLATSLPAVTATESVSNKSLTPVVDPPDYDEAIDNGTFGYYPIRTYATEEGLSSPQTNFLQWNQRCDDGRYYFVTPRGWSIPDPGPMILDERGELVWTHHFDNKFGGQAYDLQVQQYRGEDYLTFWLGDDRVRGHGSGWYYMVSTSAAIFDISC